MDVQKFLSVYLESRNGANGFFTHRLGFGGRFEYSDGVKDLVETGCYWLLDIVATECLKPLRNSLETHSILKVQVKKSGRANITLTIADGVPPIWKRTIEWTDMPKGEWLFELVDEGRRFAFILLSEH